MGNEVENGFVYWDHAMQGRLNIPLKRRSSCGIRLPKALFKQLRLLQFVLSGPVQRASRVEDEFRQMVKVIHRNNFVEGYTMLVCTPHGAIHSRTRRYYHTLDGAQQIVFNR